jgi:hypothetical protein
MNEIYDMSYDQWCDWQDKLDKQAERWECYREELKRRAELFNEKFQKALDLDDDFPEEKGELLSDCCGAPPLCNGDSDFTDIGICPDCGEHCEFI